MNQKWLSLPGNCKSLQLKYSALSLHSKMFWIVCIVPPCSPQFDFTVQEKYRRTSTSGCYIFKQDNTFSKDGNSGISFPNGVLGLEPPRAWDCTNLKITASVSYLPWKVFCCIAFTCSVHSWNHFCIKDSHSISKETHLGKFFISWIHHMKPPMNPSASYFFIWIKHLWELQPSHQDKM